VHARVAWTSATPASARARVIVSIEGDDSPSHRPRPRLLRTLRAPEVPFLSLISAFGMLFAPSVLPDGRRTPPSSRPSVWPRGTMPAGSPQRQSQGLRESDPSEHSSGTKQARRGRSPRPEMRTCGSVGRSRLTLPAPSLRWRHVAHAPARCPASGHRAGLDRAQRRHRRYRRLDARGKPKLHVVTAVARELTGFVWATLTP
jgi:hypothetical protein